MINIITVVKDNKPGLEKTIGSIAHVKREDVKYFVVDGGSVDGTAELLGAREDDIVDAWVSEPDRGIYDAMNKGLGFVEKGHILFVGAGDRLLWLPTARDIDEYDIAYGDVMIGKRRYRSRFGWRMRIGNTLHHQGLFVKLNAIPSELFDLRYSVWSDMDMNQKLYRRGVSHKRLDAVVCDVEPGGISAKADRNEMVDITRKNFGALMAQIVRAIAAYNAIRSAFVRAVSRQ